MQPTMSQKGDLYGVHPQASFSSTSSLIGQWETLADNWKKEENEVGMQSDLSFDIIDVKWFSPQIPFGFWFQ